MIFLDLASLPYNLARMSISVVSYLVHLISDCACCNTDLLLAGLGGKGTTPFPFSKDESSESESLNAFLMGLRY